MNDLRLKDLELRFRLFDWHDHGICPWVLARIHLSNRLIYWRTGTAAKSRARPSLARLVEALQPPFATPRLTPADFLLFSQSTYRSAIGDRTYDRLMDPIRHLLTARGASVAHIEFHPTTKRLGAPAMPTIDVSPLLRRRRLQATMLPGGGTTSDSYRDLQALAASEGFSSLMVSDAVLGKDTRTLLSYASVFDRILERTRPRAVFVACYYSLPALALVLAANRRGIETIDVQHGVQGAGHLCYAGWDHLGVEAANMLPTTFAVWGNTEAATIAAWGTAKKRRAVVTGNLWQAMWQAGRYDQIVSAAAASDTGLAGAVNRLHGVKPNVLVSLQRGYPDHGLTAPLIAAIKSRRDVQWWVRAHPSMLESLEAVEADLRLLGVDGVEFRAASTLPLPCLLAHTRAHVTASSSVILEAATWGVPSIAVLPPVPGYYVAELAAGTLRIAEDAATLDRLLDDMLVGQIQELKRAAEATLAAASDALGLLGGAAPHL